jgi:hypothetical protein
MSNVFWPFVSQYLHPAKVVAFFNHTLGLCAMTRIFDTEMHVDYFDTRNIAAMTSAITGRSWSSRTG